MRAHTPAHVHTHTHTHTRTHTVESYAAMRKKEILPSVTMWMKLEAVVLSEISQTKKTNTVGGIKKEVKLIEAESRVVVARG